MVLGYIDLPICVKKILQIIKDVKKLSSLYHFPATDTYIDVVHTIHILLCCRVLKIVKIYF
jgi:hypothetical protein